MAPTAVNNSTAEPFWGRHTATLDWCESNYEVSLRVRL